MLSKIKQILINQSINNPIKTLFLSLGLTLFVFLGIQYFYLEDDLIKTFPKNLSSKVIWDEIQDDFGETEFVFVAFGKDSLKYNILEDANAIKSTIEFTSAIEDSLSHYINKVISISNTNKISSNDYNELDIGPLLNEDFLLNFTDTDSVKVSLNQIQDYFYKNPDQEDRFVSTNKQYLSIALRPKKLLNMSSVVPEIKKLAEKHLDGYEIHYAGQPYIGGETPELIKTDISTLMGIGILIMILVLFFNFRSLFAVFIIILTIVCSLLSMLGFMGWMRFLTGTEYFDFTMMNTSMPIILLTIANSDGVHIVSRFFREFRKIGNKKEALVITMNALTQPIFLTSITTSAAFITMIFSPLDYMIGYAFGIAFGVMWALFLSCTMIPSLLMLKNWSTNSRAISKESIIEKLTTKISNLVFNNPQKVLISSLIIVFISLIGIWFVKVEVNIMKFFKPGSVIRDSTEFVDDNFTGTMNLSIKLKTEITDSAGIPNYENYEQLYELKHFLEKNEKINITISLVDVLDQSYKVFMDLDSTIKIPDKDALDGVYQFLMLGNPEEMQDDLQSLIGEPLELCFPSETFTDTNKNSKWDDREPFIDCDIQNDNFICQDDVDWEENLGNHEWDDAFCYSNDGVYIDFENIDQVLLTAMINTISTAEIQELVTSTEQYVEQNINLEGDNTKVEISGLSVFINEFVNIILQSSILSILLSIFLILIITWIFFRSFKWGMLSIVPLASAVVLNFGLMGLTGIHLNHMTALLSAVIIGVGVDFSIHYISDYRRNLIQKVSMDQINRKTSTDVGYPILLDVGSNMGFIALFASVLIPINHMGGLMAFAMLSTSFGTLTILASLIQILKIRKV